MRGRDILKILAVALLALVVLVGGTLAVLLLTAPGPGEAEGWALLDGLPSPRGELATAVVHRTPCPEPPCPEAELLYVVGGLAGLGRTEDAVASYDPVARKWSEAPPLPEPRHHLGAAGLDQVLHVTGGAEGMLQPWEPRANHWRFDPATGRWDVLPAMPEGRWGHRLVAYQGRLYVVGGEGPTARVLVYDPDAGWSAGADMPEPRDHLSAVVVGGRIWAIGGRAPGSMTRVDIYDPIRDRWEPGPELPAPASGAAEGVVANRILVYGGEEPSLVGGRVFHRHWLLDLDAPERGWQPAPPPPLAVHGADGAVFQGSLVIAGGASRHGALSVTAWTDAVQWLEVPPALDRE